MGIVFYLDVTQRSAGIKGPIYVCLCESSAPYGSESLTLALGALRLACLQLGRDYLPTSAFERSDCNRTCAPSIVSHSI